MSKIGINDPFTAVQIYLNAYGWRMWLIWLTIFGLAGLGLFGLICHLVGGHHG